MWFSNTVFSFWKCRYYLTANSDNISFSFTTASASVSTVSIISIIELSRRFFHVELKKQQKWSFVLFLLLFPRTRNRRAEVRLSCVCLVLNSSENYINLLFPIFFTHHVQLMIALSLLYVLLIPHWISDLGYQMV